MSVGKDCNTACFHYSLYLHNSYKHLILILALQILMMKGRENWVCLQNSNRVRNDMSWKNLGVQIAGDKGRKEILPTQISLFFSICFYLDIVVLFLNYYLSFSFSTFNCTYCSHLSPEIILSTTKIGWTY